MTIPSGFFSVLALHFRASLVARMVKNLPAMQETRVQSLGWEDHLEKGMATTLVFLPGKSHGQRSLVGYIVCGVAKSWTRLSDYIISMWKYDMCIHICILL